MTPLESKRHGVPWPRRLTRWGALGPLGVAACALGFGLWWAWVAQGEVSQRGAYPSYTQWNEACSELPSNRLQPRRYTPRGLLPLPRFRDFGAVIDDFFKQCEEGALARAPHWLGEPPAGNTFFNHQLLPGVETPFQPFAQRMVVPSGSEVIFHGDLHGDVRSLLHSLETLNEKGYLEGFKITRPNVYLVFLGDYTDRGAHGVEVIYTILRLKLANPDRVCLVRGNHEDLKLVSKYGFFHEGAYKYGRDFDHRKVARIYDYLPVVLYLGDGKDFVQCNHGGMEPGYRAKALLEAGPEVRFHLLGELKRADLLQEEPDFMDRLPADDQSRRFARLLYQNFKPSTPTSPDLLGFMWSDFALQGHEPMLRWDEKRPGWRFGREGTEMLLEKSSGPEARLRAVIRAHQHSSQLNPMMRRLIAGRGLFRHWQDEDQQALLNADLPQLRQTLESKENRPLVEDAVYTLNVSPDSIYGRGCNYDEDTFAVLRIGDAFTEWHFELINTAVPKN